MESQRFEAEPATEKKKGLSGCLIAFIVGFGVVIVVVGAIAWWLSNNWKSLLVSGGTQALVAAIDESNLAAEEKLELKAELARLGDGFEEGTISDKQMMEIVENLIQSPLISLFVVSAIETGYVDKSGLSEEEKAAASVTLQRFASGMMSEKISQEELNEVLEPISDRDADGNLSIKDKVTDEELQAFLALAALKADEAEVPELIEPIDPSDELKKIIDAVLLVE